jgi:uncharacterized membrane protein
MTNGISTQNSQLLAHLFEIQPNAVILVHAVRQWMKALGYDGLKGYPITLLVLFFLQHNKLMPSVKTVQSGLSIVTISGMVFIVFIYLRDNSIKFHSQDMKFNSIQAATAPAMVLRRSATTRIWFKSSSSSTACSITTKLSQLTKE